MTQQVQALRAGLVAIVFAIPLLAPSAALDAAPPSLEGTDWNLSGRAVLSGVAKEGRRTIAYRDSHRSTLSASFLTATTFRATDQDGRVYTGTWTATGRRAAAVRFTLDASSSDVLTAAIESWLSVEAEDAVTVTPRRTAIKAVARGSRIRMVLLRTYSATTSNARATGRYVVRESGRNVL